MELKVEFSSKSSREAVQVEMFKELVGKFEEDGIILKENCARLEEDESLEEDERLEEDNPVAANSGERGVPGKGSSGRGAKERRDDRLPLSERGTWSADDVIWPSCGGNTMVEDEEVSSSFNKGGSSIL